MRRIRKSASKNMAKNDGSMSPETRKKIIIAVSLIVLAVIVAVLVIVEDSMKKKYTIRNHTDKDIKNIEVVFELGDGSTCTELFLGSIKAGEQVKGNYEPYDFSLEEDTGDLWVYVEFEGEKGIEFIDGMLYNKFDGSVSIDFVQEDGEYRVNLDSDCGLLSGSEVAGIEAKIQLDLENEDWNYMLYSKSEDKWIIDESMKLEWDELVLEEDEE